MDILGFWRHPTNCMSEQKITREIAIKIGKSIVAKFGEIKLGTLKREGVEEVFIISEFMRFKNFLVACRVPLKRRPQNMTNTEFKEYLRCLAEINENGCWITDRYKGDPKHDHHSILYEGCRMGLHRLSYILNYGIIKNKKLVVMHKCDNPPCFNPKHLELGTRQKNVQDAIDRGLKKYKKGNKNRVKPHKLRDPYDYKKLIAIVKKRVFITSKNEWLYKGAIPKSGYPVIKVNKRNYQFHRLIVANKVRKKYDNVIVASHRLPDGSKPQKHDLNPDHLFEGSYSENMYDTLKYRKEWTITKEKYGYIIKRAEKIDKNKYGSIGKFDEKLAKEFNIKRDVIADIRLGRTYNNFSEKTFKKKV